MTVAAVFKHLVFCLALAGLSALVVRGMIRVGVMDHPEARKAHRQPVPKGGGVGVVAAFMVGISALYLFAEFARLGEGYFRGVILASGGIAVVAWLDDTRDWPFWVKLAGAGGGGAGGGGERAFGAVVEPAGDRGGGAGLGGGAADAVLDIVRDQRDELHRWG